MCAGAIAYYYLKAHDPATLGKVLQDLRQHPWYAGRWSDSITAHGFQGEQADIALFMYASTFPDDARKDPEYGGSERAKWHYIDYPFVPAGQQIEGAPPDTPNAEIRLEDLMTGTPWETGISKAVDLCWIFHITEDIHQPLHTVSMFDNAHPHGDRGGNDIYVLLPGDSLPERLHYFWDGLISKPEAEIPAYAYALSQEKQYSDRKLSELRKDKTLHEWIVNESVPLAEVDAYANGSISGTRANPSLLSETYIAHAHVVAERRIVVSGIRLAKELSSLYTGH